MIPSHWLTPTRESGLAAYGIALVCSAIAWRRAWRGRTASSLAARLTLIEALLLIDMAIDARWKLHQLLADAAQGRHDYDLRRLPQTVVVAVLAGMLIAGLLIAVRLYRGRAGALLAVSGALVSVVSWCIEVVSLHPVDSLLYRPVGSVMAVSLVWTTACVSTSVGILIDSRMARISIRPSQNAQ
jgi:hypothetical protein